MNQNLLIVDDEKDILSWLEELFRFEAGMDLDVYTASSATEALSLLSKVRFDVVLTDIRMPGMDGIALFGHIKENWPRCKTVFLTGFRNFEDMYQVTRHRDVQYILKSEDDDAIVEAVKNAFRMSQQDMEHDLMRLEQGEWLEKTRRWLRRDFMEQLFSGAPTENVDEQMRALGIPLEHSRPVQAAFLRIEAEQSGDLFHERFIEDGLIQLLKENAPPKLRFYTHIISNDTMALLIQPANAEEEDWNTIQVISKGAVEYAQEQFKTIYSATFSAVMSAKPCAFSQVSQAVSAMRKAMVSHIGGAREAILNMDAQDDLGEALSQATPAIQTTALQNYLETKKEQEYFSLLNSYLQWLVNRESKHDPKALEVYYNIAIFLLRFINENHMNEEISFRIGLYQLTMAEEHADWAKAARYLVDVSEAIFQQLSANEDVLNDRALKRVIAYIDGHLQEDVSLTELADIGGFNASYLSRLFRQITGETITNYMTRKRLALAEDLLQNTNMKIQDIAVKMGYSSPRSFIRAFRNGLGVSPTDYRDTKK